MTPNQTNLNKLIILVLIFCSLNACQNNPKPAPKILPDLTQYVDPQIGSVHGRWFFYTPAALPFGMAKLAPHTNAYNSVGSWGPTGYDDRHTSIEGFGHFHEFQIGGLVYMPTVGNLQTTPGTLENPDLGYRSRFDKTTEHAEAGYYSVHLKDYGIKTELTASARVGYQKYTFPKTNKAHVIIDLGHKQGESSTVTRAQAKIINGNEVEGFIEIYPVYLTFCDPDKRVRMYFVAKFNQNPTQVGSFIDNTQFEGKTETDTINNGLYLTFSTEKDSIIEVQTGLSYTSIENARNNLTIETKNNSFEAVKVAAKEAWNEKLNRIYIEGGEKTNRIKFYTGLYHALLGRGLSNDVNGDYPLVDFKIGKTPLNADGQPKYNHYNTDGIWGGFWNLTQLWALAYPDYFSDYIQSNIDFYKDRGWLHDGTAAGTYTNGVQTNFQALIMASAYNVGIRDFDVKTGFEAALKNELNYKGRNLGNGKYDLAHFVKEQYVPYKDTIISNGWLFNFGASHTLEYAFSSFAVAQMAKHLSDTLNANKLLKQAGYYKNIFDPETKYMRPKLPNGKFIKNFNPLKAWDGFQEGNAYQYTWYVPHDPNGLINLIGKDLFNKRLEDMFNDAKKSMFGGDLENIDSFSGVEKLYNHGNQPCLFNAWLFNYSGKPWLTQKWVREICNDFYGTGPIHGYGVGQDEDQGQLGAWYVMASMGLFDVQGLTAYQPSFQFSSPLFDKITIQLNSKYYKGNTLVIETEHQSKNNSYIQSASWNGTPINTNWMLFNTLTQGGTLKFNLSDTPNTQWGIEKNPPSMSALID